MILCKNSFINIIAYCTIVCSVKVSNYNVFVTSQMLVHWYYTCHIFFLNLPNFIALICIFFKHCRILNIFLQHISMVSSYSLSLLRGGVGLKTLIDPTLYVCLTRRSTNEITALCQMNDELLMILSSMLGIIYHLTIIYLGKSSGLSRQAIHRDRTLFHSLIRHIKRSKAIPEVSK